MDSRATSTPNTGCTNDIDVDDLSLSAIFDQTFLSALAKEAWPEVTNAEVEAAMANIDDASALPCGSQDSTPLASNSAESENTRPELKADDSDVIVVDDLVQEPSNGRIPVNSPQWENPDQADEHDDDIVIVSSSQAKKRKPLVQTYLAPPGNRKQAPPAPYKKRKAIHERFANMPASPVQYGAGLPRGVLSAPPAPRPWPPVAIPGLRRPPVMPGPRPSTSQMAAAVPRAEMTIRPNVPLQLVRPWGVPGYIPAMPGYYPGMPGFGQPFPHWYEPNAYQREYDMMMNIMHGFGIGNANNGHGFGLNGIGNGNNNGDRFDNNRNDNHGHGSVVNGDNNNNNGTQVCNDCNRNFPSDECFEKHKERIAYKSKDLTVCDAWKKCADCNRYINPPGRKYSDPHVCYATLCLNCKEFVLPNHLCYILNGEKAQNKKAKPKNQAVAESETFASEDDAVSDFLDDDAESEARSEEFCDDVDEVVSDDADDECEDSESTISETSKKQQVRFENKKFVFDFETCLDNSRYHQPMVVAMMCLDDDSFEICFSGYGCVSELLEWIFKNCRSCTFLSHNGKRYDNFFILSGLEKEGHIVEKIQDGSSITMLKIPGLKCKFIDTLSFMPRSLSELPKIWELTI
ncbi:uncharacterized protein LOC129587023 [Paramacrobiotus metropolitanus]|uniref:uncharacterized protein LOC129587023 n=1 Tax=Paramacrobiotus metropolitanus TaxID=2943436 RepID=UPI002445CAF3|nr:uncharacterized protein LOC129587023 [Paramacrobiotus metropolitanus]